MNLSRFKKYSQLDAGKNIISDAEFFPFMYLSENIIYRIENRFQSTNNFHDLSINQFNFSIQIQSNNNSPYGPIVVS